MNAILMIPISAAIAAVFGLIMRFANKEPEVPAMAEIAPVEELSFRDRVLGGYGCEITHNAVYNALYQARKEISKTGLGGWITSLLSECEEMDAALALTAIEATRRDAERWGALPRVEKALADAERKILEAGE